MENWLWEAILERCLKSYKADFRVEIKQQCKYKAYTALSLYFFPIGLLSLKFLRHWFSVFLGCRYINNSTIDIVQIRQLFFLLFGFQRKVYNRHFHNVYHSQKNVLPSCQEMIST